MNSSVIGVALGGLRRQLKLSETNGAVDSSVSATYPLKRDDMHSEPGAHQANQVEGTLGVRGARKMTPDRYRPYIVEAADSIREAQTNLSHAQAALHVPLTRLADENPDYAVMLSKLRDHLEELEATASVLADLVEQAQEGQVVIPSREALQKRIAEGLGE